MIPRGRTSSREAGFTLIEVLMATLLMTIILGALATVTSQWLPNWNRGMARVQRLEKLALGIERIAADLSVAEMIAPAHHAVRRNRRSWPISHAHVMA